MDGLAELKVKESDRLAATVARACRQWRKARAEGDSLIVQGAERVRGGVGSRSISITASPWRS